jgi:dynein heavy chain 1, cytosolic
MDHTNAENCVPDIPCHDHGHKEGEIEKELKKMALVKILRPDRFIMAVKNFVGKVLGEQVLNIGDLDLMKIVEKESSAKSPLLLVSAPGFDASYKVDMLAKQANKKYTSVAIGSPEAFDLVD